MCPLGLISCGVPGRRGERKEEGGEIGGGRKEVREEGGEIEEGGRR